MSKLGLDRQLRSFRRGKRSLMRDLARNSENFFLNNFQAQAFVDTPRRRWKPLKKPRRNGSTKPILIDTGRLKGSSRHRVISPNRAKVMFNAKYASYHNKGTRRLPKRQFSGESKILNKQNEKIILNYIKKRLG